MADMQLKGKHIKMISKMIFKMNLKVETSKDMSQMAFGFAMVIEIIKKIYLADTELNALLGDILNVPAENIDDMALEEIAGALRTVVMSVINFINPPETVE